MNEPQIATAVIEQISKSSKRRFIFMILASIFISAVLVIVSVFIYSSSGAIQLDLSRPGYSDVRSQAVTDSSDLKYYSNSGAIDQKSITEFKELYAKQKKKIDSVDAFGSDPLSKQALGVEAQ